MTTDGSLTRAINTVNPQFGSSIPIPDPVRVITNHHDYVKLAEEIRQAMPSKIIGQFLAQNTPSTNRSS